MVRARLLGLAPAVAAQRRLYGDLVSGRVPDEPEPHLEALLAFIRERNPYYAGLLKGGAAFRDLPPLTKTIMRDCFDRLKSEGVEGPTRVNSSGGSTGMPQTFLQDEEYARWRGATETYYYRELLGVDPVETPKVVLWGSHRDTRLQKRLKGRLVNWLSNTVFLDAFSADDADWERYVEVINAAKPHFVRGYAGSLYLVAQVVRRRNLRLFSPRFVYSSAETLHPWMRREIEEAFGAPVRDFYGSREVGPVAGECRSGRKHVFAFNNLVESAGGRLLVTNLHNRVMPLVRYEIGDTGALGQGPCPCGSRLPWLERLEGRILNHFIRKDGTLIYGGYFAALFMTRRWVREFQVSQLGYEEVEIRVVKDGGGDTAREEMKEIDDKIRLVLGEGCRIEWKPVASIPTTPEGKRLHTRCLIIG